MFVLPINWAVSRVRRLFFGWWVVIGGIAGIAISTGLFMHGFQFYFEPMRKQFGWSRTLLSGAYSLSRVESGLLGPFGGYLVQRYGSRICMALGFVILAIGFVLLSQTRSVASFYVAFLVLSVGSGLSAWTPVTPAINNWFRRKRSRALGYMMFGMGFGGLALAPLVGYFVNIHGWERTALGCGVIVLVAGIPISRLMRYSPEPYGYLPDGEVPHTEKEQNGIPNRTYSGPSSSGLSRKEVEFTVKEALVTPAFWLMSIGHSVALLVISTLGLHLVPYLEADLNFSRSSAAQALMITSGSAMAAQLFGGFLGDRFPKNYIAAITMIGHASGLFLLATATGFTQVAFASILQGMAWGIRGPAITAMRGEYFGRKHFPVIQGYSHLVLMAGQIVGPLFAGYMADHYSYSAGFKIISVITGAGVFIFIFLRKPEPPRNKNATFNTTV